jgi:hypothetical protein
MHRREVLRLLAASAGIQALEALAPAEIFALGRRVHAGAGTVARIQPLTVLDAHANAIVIAAAERIIPASDTPGATDAQVNVFIDRMLADWFAPSERDVVLGGLRELDTRSQSLHGRDFIDCTEADQVALLAAADDEVTTLRRAAAGGPSNANDHWFSMLKYLTVWGYFTSEVAMRQTLRAYPWPGFYDGCAAR